MVLDIGKFLSPIGFGSPNETGDLNQLLVGEFLIYRITNKVNLCRHVHLGEDVRFVCADGLDAQR